MIYQQLSSKESVVLTQQEYDALSVAEKNNGITYYISDAEEDLFLSASEISATNTSGGSSNVQAILNSLSAEIGNKQDDVVYSLVTLPVNGWTSNTQTVNVTGVTANNLIIAGYEPNSRTEWLEAEIYASAQGSGTVTFTCETVPTSAVTAVIVIVD